MIFHVFCVEVKHSCLHSWKTTCLHSSKQNRKIECPLPYPFQTKIMEVHHLFHFIKMILTVSWFHTFQELERINIGIPNDFLNMPLIATIYYLFINMKMSVKAISTPISSPIPLIYHLPFPLIPYYYSLIQLA